MLLPTCLVCSDHRVLGVARSVVARVGPVRILPRRELVYLGVTVFSIEGVGNFRVPPNESIAISSIPGHLGFCGMVLKKILTGRLFQYFPGFSLYRDMQSWQ